MRQTHLAVAAAVAAAIGTGIQPGASDPQPRDLRVAAYNIRHGEGMDRRLDLDRLAGVLRGLDADLIALQEVDKGTERTGRVDQVAVIAGRLGYRGVHGAHRPYQGGEYGNAVLSRLPVLAARTHAIPPAAGSALAVLEVEVRMPGGGPVSLVSVHLAGTVEERVSQADAVTALFASANRPVILAGDFNGRTDDPAVARLDRTWRRLTKTGPPGTYPADRPDREIDFVLLSPGARLEPRAHEVVPEAVASDHRPVLAVLRVLHPPGDR